MPSCLITGATGFVGGHVAEACSERGMSVRALARPGSDTSLLNRCHATVVPGDLGDADAIAKAVEGADYVVHCAAKVGDWGPVEDYRAVNVEGVRRLLDACKGRPLQRFVHISSLGVYAARHHHGTDETEPLPEHAHGRLHADQGREPSSWPSITTATHKVPVVVLRPGFIYGPRDRTVLPKLVENLRNGVVRYLGSGDQALNTIYVGNLVEAVLLALDKPRRRGAGVQPDGRRGGVEAALHRGGGRRRWACRDPRARCRCGSPASPPGGWNGTARRRGDPQPPRLTQGRLKFLGLNLDFSIDKAKRELGYRPARQLRRGHARDGGLDQAERLESV